MAFRSRAGCVEGRLGWGREHALFVRSQPFFQLRHLLLHGCVLVPLADPFEAVVDDTIEFLLHAAVARLEWNAFLLVLAHNGATELSWQLVG